MNTKLIKNEIDEEIRKMNELEKELEERLKGKRNGRDKTFPQGKLRCVTKGNSFQYYADKQYLGKDCRQTIEEMANCDYYEEMLTLVHDKEKKLEQLQKLMKYDYCRPESLYHELHPARKCLIEPIIMSREDYIENWQNEPYDLWKINDDDVKCQILTEKGERVRSKSEKIIADSLNRYNIPYKYEYPLRLMDGNRIVTRRPDFVVLNTVTLEEKIIEHLGMMGEESYYRNNMSKISIYEKNGYLIGKKLIILHETADKPLDTSVMRAYIEEYLL